MAEENTESPETTVEDEEEPKAGKSKLIIIIAAAILLLGGGGGAAFFLGFFDSPSVEIAEEEEIVAPPPLPEVSYFPMEEITVNLTSTNGRRTYIKLITVLEVANEDIFVDLEREMPRILDTFNLYLRGLRESDLQGSAGMFRLQEALLRRVNLSIQPVKINAVRFKSIIVQ